MRLAFLFLACTLTLHCAIASAQEVGSKDLSSSAAPPGTPVTPQKETVRSRHTTLCGVMLGYFPYDSFYGHEGRVTVKKVTVKHSENSNKPQNKERSPSGAKR
jgi:hypothetical protein